MGCCLKCLYLLGTSGFVQEWINNYLRRCRICLQSQFFIRNQEIICCDPYICTYVRCGIYKLWQIASATRDAYGSETEGGVCKKSAPLIPFEQDLLLCWFNSRFNPFLVNIIKATPPPPRPLSFLPAMNTILRDRQPTIVHIDTDIIRATKGLQEFFAQPPVVSRSVNFITWV